MKTLFVNLFKLLLPWLKEWWKSKEFTPRSERALREIHVMFFMHVILFVFFMLSIEHGVSVYVRHTEHLRNSKIDVQTIQAQSERINELKEQNYYLRKGYLRLLGLVEDYARENPADFHEKFRIPAPISEMRREVLDNDYR